MFMIMLQLKKKNVCENNLKNIICVYKTVPKPFFYNFQSFWTGSTSIIISLLYSENY